MPEFRIDESLLNGDSSIPSDCRTAIIDPGDMYLIRSKLELGILLANGGATVDVFCADAGHGDEIDPRQMGEPIASNLHIQRFDNSHLSSFAAKVVKYVATGDYDIVIGHDRLGLTLAYTATRLGGGNLIYHNHHIILYDENKKVTRKVMTLAEKWAGGAAEEVICSHAKHAEKLREVLGRNRNPHVITPTHLNYPRTKDHTLRERLAAEGYDTEYVVLQSNGFAPWFHSEELIRSVAEWNEGGTLVVTGSDPSSDDPFTRKMTDIIKEHNLSDRIHFTGFLSNSELYDFALEADLATVFREPSSTFNRTHYASNVVPDMMWAGTPMVVQDTPTLERHVASNGCGIAINPSSPTTIASAINELITDKERRQDYGETGKELFKEKYALERQAQSVLQCFEELCARSRRRTPV